jgi:hypothetical protein
VRKKHGERPFVTAGFRESCIHRGFRLARERGLTSVQGLDVDGDFPLEAVIIDWARRQGRMAEIDALFLSAKTDAARITASIHRC